MTKDPKMPPRGKKNASSSSRKVGKRVFEAEKHGDAQFVEAMALLEAKLAEADNLVARHQELLIKMRATGIDAKPLEEVARQFEDAVDQRRVAFETLRELQKPRKT